MRIISEYSRPLLTDLDFSKGGSFLGQTGCGKTEIWRACRQLDPCIRIIDSTTITGEGWKGSYKVKNIFDGMSCQEAERAIVVFDEFDKRGVPVKKAKQSVQSQYAQKITAIYIYLLPSRRAG